MYWRRTMGRCEWVEFEINMLAMKQQSEVDATGGRIGECGTGSSADYRHIFHRFQRFIDTRLQGISGINSRTLRLEFRRNVSSPVNCSYLVRHRLLLCLTVDGCCTPSNSPNVPAW